MNFHRRNNGQIYGPDLVPSDLDQRVDMTAQTGEEIAVVHAVEAFRKAMLASDRSQFEKLCADQLSYGHSAGSLETKAEFIAANTDGKSVWKFITLSDQTVTVAGDTALARHMLTGETERDGKTYPIKIGILLVWQKQDGDWKLLARQAYKF
jgi:ketosteroid isomerase-like protein